MKKKMRIKVSINCEKCKRKAMEVVFNAKGVFSVAIEGDSKDELVVIADGADAVCLVDTLRKKACYATLETLEKVMPDPPPADTNMPTNVEVVVPVCLVPPHCCPPQCSCFRYGQPVPEIYEVVYDSYGPTTGCTIM